MDKKLDLILNRLNDLEIQVEHLTLIHEKLKDEIKKRNELLDELLEDQKDDWWKTGDSPPC